MKLRDPAASEGTDLFIRWGSLVFHLQTWNMNPVRWQWGGQRQHTEGRAVSDSSSLSHQPHLHQPSAEPAAADKVSRSAAEHGCVERDRGLGEAAARSPGSEACLQTKSSGARVPRDRGDRMANR